MHAMHAWDCLKVDYTKADYTKEEFISMADKLWEDINNAFYKELEPGHSKQAIKNADEMINNLLHSIHHAKSLADNDLESARCEVANSLSVDLGDERRITSGIVEEIRSKVFQEHLEKFQARLDEETKGKPEWLTQCQLAQYNRDIDKFRAILESIAGVEPEWFTCERCKQVYPIFFPKSVFHGNMRERFRNTNNRAVHEMVYLSGLCDACWQECFNEKVDEED